MQNEIRFKKIGIEKLKSFHNKFDELYDLYKKKAEKMGYFGELKFIKEKGKILIYITTQYLN